MQECSDDNNNIPCAELSYVSWEYNSSLSCSCRQVESSSYKEIFLSLGLDDTKSVMFATDSIKEAEAAEKAGWSVALAVRPGNAPLPAEAASNFRIVKSMEELLDF